jgi:hypothetical protein
MATFQKAKPLSATQRPAGPQARTELKGSGSSGLDPRPLSWVIPHDQIAQRAYELYACRGYAPGNPDEDWLEAERQLRAGL